MFDYTTFHDRSFLFRFTLSDQVYYYRMTTSNNLNWSWKPPLPSTSIFHTAPFSHPNEFHQIDSNRKRIEKNSIVPFCAISQFFFDLTHVSYNQFEPINGSTPFIWNKMWNSKNVQIGVREMIQFVSSVSSQLIALFELFDKMSGNYTIQHTRHSSKAKNKRE